MLSRKGIEERLKDMELDDFDYDGCDPRGSERESLETAQQLAEWLEGMYLQEARPWCLTDDETCPRFLECGALSKAQGYWCSRGAKAASEWLEA